MGKVIWLVRHGNRQDFVEPNWCETAARPFDPSLSEDGIVQAQELAKRLSKEKISCIFSSPFLRTVETANYISDVLSLPIKLEWGLSEWLNPDWFPAFPEVLPTHTLSKLFPKIDLEYASCVTPLYPEKTMDNVRNRTSNMLLGLGSEYSGGLLMVGHGASLQSIISELIPDKKDIKCPLCGLFKLIEINKEWVLEVEADVSHLSSPEKAMRFH
jgi:broad specificity phosphatase PhoE